MHNLVSLIILFSEGVVVGKERFEPVAHISLAKPGRLPFRSSIHEESGIYGIFRR
jgi:hypothetical protein